MPARPLPSGTLTFVFTDVEGSTCLAEHLGTARYSAVLEPWDRPAPGGDVGERLPAG